MEVMNISTVGGHIAYLGTAITSAIWCPIDRHTESSVMCGDQHAAILSNNVAADSKEAFTAPGSIQIWRIRNLGR